ncbi:MAG: HPr family phosphocarrier protein [Alphaproteobacteria bacterium]|nr:HPr family phosphocarrier protein [Alphaproteobacteria bacterium]
MVEADLEITNRRGLHARAAAKFAQLAGAFDARITVSKDGSTVPGDSIMGLMMLSAATGSRILVRAEGGDAQAALDALKALVAGGFNED